jgi:succinate dehydrogenase / fumarate reductase, cytochrome b subunit
MKWVTDFFNSSIGRKLIMSLTGLFMILFLIVHLIGNFQLLKTDNGQAFNEYTYFMTHNPLIKTISYGLYVFILLHTIQGLLIWWSNRKAKGITNSVSYKNPNVSWAGQNMALLGTLILAFLVIHMGDFWFKMKFTEELQMVSYPDSKEPMKDLYQAVATTYSSLGFVIAYVISMVVLYFHLNHGFSSAFQTIGWNHPKYTPIIKSIGKLYSILIPLGFAIIPILFYYNNK